MRRQRLRRRGVDAARKRGSAAVGRRRLGGGGAPSLDLAARVRLASRPHHPQSRNNRFLCLQHGCANQRENSARPRPRAVTQKNAKRTHRRRGRSPSTSERRKERAAAAAAAAHAPGRRGPGQRRAIVQARQQRIKGLAAPLSSPSLLLLVLDEADVLGVLAEALAAHVEAVLADDAAAVAAHAAAFRAVLFVGYVV